MLAHVRADGDEDRVELAGCHFRQYIYNFMIDDDLYSHGFDPPNLAHEIFTGQTIRGNTEMHHAAGQWPRLMNLRRMAHAGKVVRRRQTTRSSANHQNPFAAWCRRTFECPGFLGREIAKEALDGVDADRGVELSAIAGRFAGVVADPPVHRRQRVVPHQVLPSLLVPAGLCEVQPTLNVLAGGTGAVTGRQEVVVDRMGAARRTRLPPAGHIDRRAHVVNAVVHVSAFAIRMDGAAGGPARPGRLSRRTSDPATSSDQTIINGRLGNYSC